MMTKRFRRGDDSGVSLVLALVFVTVVAVVVGVVLSFADTSLRATIALRDQAAATAAADGAAQIAINALRKSAYDGSAGNCFGAAAGDTTLPLPNVYQRPSGTFDSARVTCERDAANSSLPIPTGVPDRALLTLYAGGLLNTHLWPGISVDGSGNMRVQGDVHTNGRIDVDSPASITTVDGAVRARGGCTGGGTITPTPVCNSPGLIGDPGYPAPSTGSLPNRSVPSCRGGTNRVVSLQAGVYNNFDLNDLNDLTDDCRGIFHFQPGTYYFTFNGTWEVDSGFLVAGTPTTPLVDGMTLAVPGTCQSPIPPATGAWTPPAAGAGVQFVFAAGARMEVSGRAQVEICGPYSSTAVPVAVYAQGGFFNDLICNHIPLPCTVIRTRISSNPTKLYVQGTTYLPTRDLSLELDSRTSQAFRGGVVARSVRIETSLSGSGPPVIEVPDSAAGDRRTVVWLNVYVCPGASSCTTGTLRLRAKVGFADPTGTPVAGARQVTVYSWSVQR